jgi:hypothetical protein
MSVLVTTVHCVGTLDTRKFNAQPPNRITPDKYRIPLQTFSLYGMRQNLSPSPDDSDSGISLVGTSQSYLDAQSSPAHGAE